MRAAAGDYDLANPRSATKAGLAGPAVNLVLLLKISAVSQPINVICDRGAAGRNGLLKRRADRVMEPACLRPVEAGCQSGRIQPRGEQALIRVNVSESAQESLIEQKALEHGAAAPKKTQEFREVDIEGIGAKGTENFLGTVEQLPAAEPADVGVVKPTPRLIEAKDEVRMRAEGFGRRFAGQLPCHSEMDQQCADGAHPIRCREIQNEMLPVAANCGNRGAANRFHKVIWTSPFRVPKDSPQYKSARPGYLPGRQLRVKYAPTRNQGPEAANNRLHFRKLRQVTETPNCRRKR